VVKAALVMLACAACGTFEDPNVVIDLRVLAMTATPPEQVLDVSQTQDPLQLAKQLKPAKVCALVADPNFDRRLRYRLTVCNLDGGRCDLSGPHLVFAQGLLDDPDTTVPEPQLCGTIPVDDPGSTLPAVLLSALNADPLQGLGGLYYGAELVIGGEDADPALDLYAAKSLAVMPNIPADRTANNNPTISGLTATIDGVDSPIDLVRCAEATAPLELTTAQKVRLTPIEPDGIHEVYSVPTVDGTQRTFTENISYQWVAGAGSLSKGDTGGPHDAFGNPAPLFTDFTSPSTDEITDPTTVAMWIVQRDERLGEAWFETCFHVTPSP
jgi:hypothetical protein